MFFNGSLNHNFILIDEKDYNEKQKELITAKTEALKSAKRVEELYANAITAMKLYSGNGGGVERDEP